MTELSDLTVAHDRLQSEYSLLAEEKGRLEKAKHDAIQEFHIVRGQVKLYLDMYRAGAIKKDDKDILDGLVQDVLIDGKDIMDIIK